VLMLSDWFRFSHVSFVYDQRMPRCRYPQITHYVFTLHIASTYIHFPVFQSACKLLTSLFYCVTKTRSQTLTHSHFPAIKTSIVVRNSEVNNSGEVITGLDARGCALGRSTLGPMFHEIEGSP
jgi:hypothetical protein